MSIATGLITFVALAGSVALVLGLTVLAEKWLEKRIDRDEAATPSKPQERPVVRIVNRRPKAA